MRVRPNLRDQPTEYLEILSEEIRQELAFRKSIQPQQTPYTVLYGPPCDPDPMYKCVRCGKLEHELFNSCPKCGRV